jgi:hypothetical protein
MNVPLSGQGPKLHQCLTVKSDPCMVKVRLLQNMSMTKDFLPLFGRQLNPGFLCRDKDARWGIGRIFNLLGTVVMVRRTSFIVLSDAIHYSPKKFVLNILSEGSIEVKEHTEELTVPFQDLNS